MMAGAPLAARMQLPTRLNGGHVVSAGDVKIESET